MLGISIEDISRLRVLFIRLANKYRMLDSKALNFGTDDLLYPSEIHVIEAIGKNYGNTVNEISFKFGVTKGAISQIVNKLTRKGLVDKRRNPDYHKEVILSLTPGGRKAFESHESLHNMMDKELLKFMQNFDKEELQNFETFILKIDGQIEKYIDYAEKK